MKSVFHLSTCSTCKRILTLLQSEQKGFELQDIKTEPITDEQLSSLANLAGSYEALFSRRAMKFRAMGLHEKELGEADYRDLILSEYTFLKRPVIVDGNNIFIGNAKKTIEAAQAHLA